MYGVAVNINTLTCLAIQSSFDVENLISVLPGLSVRVGHTHDQGDVGRNPSL